MGKARTIEPCDNDRYIMNGFTFWQGGLFYYSRHNNVTKRISKETFIKVRDYIKELERDVIERRKEEE